AIFHFLREVKWDALNAVGSESSDILTYLTGKSSLCFQNLADQNECSRLTSPFVLFDLETCDSFSSNSVALVPGSISDSEIKRLNLNGVGKLIAVTSFPKEIPAFELVWSKRKRINLVSSPENKWTLEHLMMGKKCRISGFKTDHPELSQLEECNSLYYAESETSKISRKEKLVASFNAVNTIAFGLRKAWEDRCHNIPGFCNGLQTMSSHDFYELYLKGLEFYNDGPGSRSPAGVSGGKMRTSAVGELRRSKFIFVEYKTQGFKIVAEQLFIKDDSGLKRLSQDVSIPQFPCDKEGCHSCKRGLKSVELPLPHPMNYYSSDLQADFTEVISKTASVTSRDTEEKTLTLIIPALLPVHKSGPTPLQCGTVINQEAIYGVEALLWALDQINRQEHILPGIELGTIVLDTCSSMSKTEGILSGLLDKSDDSSLEELGVKSGQIVAAIVALRGQEAYIASELFSQENITSVNALSQAISHEGNKKYSVEIDVSYEKIALALVKLLKRQKIMQILLLYSQRNEELQFAFRHLRRLCDSHDIHVMAIEAISDNVLMEDVLQRLKEKDTLSRWNSDDHQQVVVTLLSKEDADDFMAALVEAEDLATKPFLIGVGSYWDQFSKDPDFTKAVSGAAFISSDWNPVQEFVEYFRKLKPSMNDRNPWFYEYWEQNMEDDSCPEESEEDSCKVRKVHDSFTEVATVGAKMIQSVYLLASSLVRVQKEACQGHRHMKECSVERFYDRLLLNEFIRKTGTDRVDFNETDFRLTPDGYGDIDVAVWNIRRAPSQDRFIRSPVIMKKVGLFDNKLKLNSNLLTYNDQGREVVLSDIFGKNPVTLPTTTEQTSTTQRRRISIITRTRPTTAQTEPMTHSVVDLTTLSDQTIQKSSTAVTVTDCFKDPSCLKKMQNFSSSVKVMQ
ncbi:hypothetical protein QYM36_012744, partial [Artemia franciscana]